MSLHLTRRALADIRKVRAESVKRHGKLVAKQYLQALEQSLMTIEEHPSLLMKRHFSEALRFYFSGKHALICSVTGNDIYVTAVWFDGMNIEHIVPEFEPTLLEEASIMHKKLQKKAG